MNRIRQTQTRQQTSVTAGITELIIANALPEQVALVMPMIAFLTKSCANRWVTWIAPQHVSREFLESFDVDTRYVRLIHCSDEQSRLWITWEALAAGNSHTVISSPGKLTEKELKQLESAASQGQCQGLLLRVR
ncbi:MAG: hypothetical protein EOO52_10080 [Gammaproteobacteria bacterium]|nr:MAG: hypothetical protein EOO52_10080 [Gammaproteobacteria bacterium]